MSKLQKITFAIMLLIACFSAYSLAEMNQAHIISFEWNNNNSFINAKRSSTTNWTSTKYCDYMNFDVIIEPDKVVTIDGDFAIKRVFIPEVDYDNNFLIFATLGEVKKDSYKINIKDIGQRGNVVEVMVDMTEPKSEENLPFAKNYPYDIVKVSNSALAAKGNILFIFKDINGNELSRKQVTINGIDSEKDNI
jgi:hypothetical protein